MKIVLLLFSLLWWPFLLRGTPTLTSSGREVAIGSSLTFTCTFQSQPLFLGITFRSSNNLNCGINTASCTGALGLCQGNTYNCSDDGLDFNFTLVNVNDTFHDQSFNCYDAFVQNQSNEIVVSVIVPVSTVNIAPLNSVIDVVEGSSVYLTCTTDPSRPQSNITWHRNNAVIPGTTQSVTNVTRNKYTTTSILTVNGDRTLQGAHIYCSALNTQGRSPVTSSTKTLNMKYPPDGPPTISGNPPGLTYNDSAFVTLTCTSGESNPTPTLLWTCNGLSKTERTMSLGLMFTVNKTFNGKTCECTATHVVGNFRQRQNASLVVYYAAEILRVNQSDQQTYEGNDLMIHAQVDGNPPPVLTWTNVDNNTVIKTDPTSGSSRYLNFPGINCLDTALYSAKASNGYGVTVERTINVTVVCLPRLDIRKTQQTTVPVGEAKKLNISLFTVSNPRPSITWFFKRDNLSYILRDGSDIQVTMTKLQKVEYHIQMTKSGLEERSFDDYIVQLSNSVGVINITFTMFLQGPPDAPSGVTVRCTESFATISWTGGFNGGSVQTFNIFSKENNEKTFLKVGGPYNDLNEMLSEIIQISEGLWEFIVQAENRFGETYSDSDRTCIIIGKYSSHSGDGIKTAMFAAGFFTCLALTGMAILAVYFHRRHGIFGKKKKEGNRTYDSVQGASSSTNTYEDLKRTEKKEGEKTYDSVQGTSSSTNTYEDLKRTETKDTNITYDSVQGKSCSTDKDLKRTDGNIYINASFGK